MKIAMIGAGKTGRGFIARLLAEDKNEIYFIDKDIELVNALNREKSFKISFFGNVRKPYEVSNFTASTWENADLSDIEVIFVSVGGMNLPDVGTELRNLINDGKTRHIIVGENASKPAQKLYDAIGLDNTTVSESTVFCTTIEDTTSKNMLDISSENYPYLQCDASPLGDYTLNISTIRPIYGFENFLTRKLYTYNAASCVIAYLGFVKGYTDYGEAANDPKILELLDRNYIATNKALCAAYGYDEKDQAEFAALSKAKFTDRTIADTVSRNAREPQRKLQYAERIIGPLCLIEKQGGDTEVLLLTAAAALLYEHESDKGWQEIKDSSSPEDIISNICGLAKGSKLSNEIMIKYKTIKSYLNGDLSDL